LDNLRYKQQLEKVLPATS